MSPHNNSLTDPSSPSADKKSIFSFYIHEPSNINPFNPSSASTLRKTHHVSMPTLPARPKLSMALKNRSSLDNLHKPAQTLQKQPSLRPFVIRVQSSACDYEDTNKDTAFTRPKQRRRSGGKVSQGKEKKRGVSWLKVCGVSIKRNFSCGSVTEESVERKHPGYYFIWIFFIVWF